MKYLYLQKTKYLFQSPKAYKFWEMYGTVSGHFQKFNCPMYCGVFAIRYIIMSCNQHVHHLQYSYCLYLFFLVLKNVQSQMVPMYRIGTGWNLVS